jgi:hypothetical protein
MLRVKTIRQPLPPVTADPGPASSCSPARFSRSFWALALICAALAFAPQAAQAQFTQDGKKLVGKLPTGRSGQGSSIAISADGSTAIVGGYSDNSYAGAAWVFTRSGSIWTQQGGKLIGTGAVGGVSVQGTSVALSADGNTAIVGGPYDNSNLGAAWVFTRSNGVWTQQGDKLVGTGAVASPVYQGRSVALSADGNTAILGGPNDNGDVGAAWIFTRSKGVWSQQGGKLTGTGAVGVAQQGQSVALSGDGATAILGGPVDNSDAGAAWVFTRSKGVWSQQGNKLAGTFPGGTTSQQGTSVALSGDGSTALVGGPGDNNSVGSVWVFARSNAVWTQDGPKLTATDTVGAPMFGNSVALSAAGTTAFTGGFGDNVYLGASWAFTRGKGGWTQQGNKLVGTGSVGPQVEQGASIALSGDGDIAIAGGSADNMSIGAAWVFFQPLEVSTYAGLTGAGPKGGPFTPSSFPYLLRATHGTASYTITGLPSWLSASSKAGALTTSPTTVTFTINATAKTLAPGLYTGAITFNNLDGKQASIFRPVKLSITP